MSNSYGPGYIFSKTFTKYSISPFKRRPPINAAFGMGTGNVK